MINYKQGVIKFFSFLRATNYHLYTFLKVPNVLTENRKLAVMAGETFS